MRYLGSGGAAGTYAEPVKGGYMVAAVVCFFLSWVAGYWARACFEKARDAALLRGESIERFGLRALRVKEPRLFRRCLVGAFLSLALMTVALVLGLKVVLPLMA